jgi:hypothetical protein
MFSEHANLFFIDFYKDSERGVCFLSYHTDKNGDANGTVQ